VNEAGNHKPFGMMKGIQWQPDLVAFVGYHAGPGKPGVLSHTFVASALFEVTLNGRAMTEGYLNSLLIAEYGARLALVAGDDLTCVDAEDYAPKAQRVAVKEAIDRYTALCMPPAGPYRCEVTFVGTSSATMAACIPDRLSAQSAHRGVHQGHDRRPLPLLPGRDPHSPGRHRARLRLARHRLAGFTS
jgi:D-aminopeptidase